MGRKGSDGLLRLIDAGRRLAEFEHRSNALLSPSFLYSYFPCLLLATTPTAPSLVLVHSRVL